MLLVSLVFGYAQWRRQRLLSEIARLRPEGVYVNGLDENWFWPRIKREATITINCIGPLSYSHNGVLLTVEAAKERIRGFEKRLRELGVTDVECVITRTGSSGGASPIHDIGGLEEDTRWRNKIP